MAGVLEALRIIGLVQGCDACFAPVPSLADAPSRRHDVARGTFGAVEGIVRPAAAPRFSDA